MHARVTQTAVDPDKVDEAVTLFEGAVEAAKGQPGFVRAFLFGDRATGRSVSVTVWETEADEARTRTEGFYQEQIARFASVLQGEPTPESFEVLFEG